MQKTNDSFTITPAEYGMNLFRETRNNLLLETDWKMLPDAQVSNSEKEDIIAYRQALRNISSDAEKWFLEMSIEEEYNQSPKSIESWIKNKIGEI